MSSRTLPPGWRQPRLLAVQMPSVIQVRAVGQLPAGQLLFPCFYCLLFFGRRRVG
jgi:hypothetical protein